MSTLVLASLVFMVGLESGLALLGLGLLRGYEMQLLQIHEEVDTYKMAWNWTASASQLLSSPSSLVPLPVISRNLVDPWLVTHIDGNRFL
jgi:hypothetical protein